MNKLHIFILIAILLFGCTEMENYYEGEGKEINRTEPLDMDNLISCDTTDHDCICMVCENSDSFEFTNPFNRFYSIDLREGECRFETDCTEEKFLEISTPDFENFLFGQEQVRFFMLGQGSNFAEFADANRYCNNSLRLAVRWLYSTDGFEYPAPQPERAECFLEKDTLPVYLLYSEGEAMSVPRAAYIASQFQESGPVILTSEFDFDPSNFQQLNDAIDQAIAMKSACPDCLIAIAPKFKYNYSEVDGEYYGYNHTYDAIDYIFETQEARDSIALVAIGLNSHYTQNCAGASLLWDGMAYSKYIMQQHGKPTLWAYVLLDDRQPSAAPYGSLEYCEWNSDEITRTYGDLYKYIPSFVNNGVIGIAPYSLYGLGTGPLECADCGMMAVDGTTYPQHAEWFSLCQVYYTGRGVIPVVFSPSPCADCSFANNFNMFQLSDSYYGSGPTIEQYQDKAVAPFSTFYRCNGQLMSEVPEEITLPSYSAGDNECNWYPELDIFSDLRDSDPVLARAITWGETGLNDDTEGPDGDMCEASDVDFGLASFPECVTDPEGRCGTQCAPTNWRKHSLGLMQIHVYPQQIWADYPPGSGTEQEALWCAGNAVDGFNPFNKAHNACVGTAIILEYLQVGKSKVSSNEQQLGLAYLKTTYGEDSDEYLNMKNAFIVFISSYYYNGFSAFQNGIDSWIYEYSKQSGITDEYCEVAAGSDPCCNSDGTAKSNNCCGVENFINYYQSCKLPTLSNQQAGAYGLRLLGHYKALLKCEKYDEAQHEQNLIDYLESYGESLEEPEEAEES